MSRSNFDKPLTLDEAIEHSEEVAGACATSCQREHKQLADWLRELKERRKHGNAAALREALLKAIILLKVCEWPDDTPMQDVAEVMDEIEKASSAPPRNCDRFVDELDAQLAFLNEVWLISVDRETMLERDKFENWSDEMKTRYGRWLLAHATERKGE